MAELVYLLPYYFGRISRDDASHILLNLRAPQTGLYLLRDDTKMSGHFIISLVKDGQYAFLPAFEEYYQKHYTAIFQMI